MNLFSEKKPEIEIKLCLHLNDKNKWTSALMHRVCTELC